MVVERHQGLRVGRLSCGLGYAQPPRLQLSGLGHTVELFPSGAECRCGFLVGQQDVVVVRLALAAGGHRQGDTVSVQLPVV